ncbi:CAM53 [Symbiodinium natans]|uniref:CAM53 protein n=1 Tax=Symbiodinium natans TaxID=878477 RepID=A0A812U2B3_9DINO|nr:CAM53 [Symbiodinium natans]
MTVDRGGEQLLLRKLPAVDRTAPITPPTIPSTVATLPSCQRAGMGSASTASDHWGLSATSWMSWPARTEAEMSRVDARDAIPLRRSQGIWDKAMPMLPSPLPKKLYQRRRYDMPFLDLSNVSWFSGGDDSPMELQSPQSSCAELTASATSIPSRLVIAEGPKCGKDLTQDRRLSTGCGHRRRQRMLVGASKTARESRSREKLLPIAPKANRSFFVSSMVSKERVVFVRKTKVKLSLSDSRRSVLAQPETPGCPTCGYRLTVSWSCPRCRGRDSSSAEVRQRSMEDEHPSPRAAGGAEAAGHSSAPAVPHPEAGHDGLGQQSANSSFHPPGSGSGTRGTLVKEESGRVCTGCGAPAAADGESCRRCGHKRPPAGASSTARASMITTEDVRADVFGKLQEHGEVHCDELPRGLELCGFVGIKKEWVQSVCDSVTKYSTLELEEFLEFVRGYESLQERAYKEAFEEADLDRSGTVESAELAEVLKQLQIEPMTHVLDEVIQEVDEEGHGELVYKEFKHLMDLLILREGFTSSEYDQFMEMFARFDRDNCGKIDAQEFHAVLNWLGYAMTVEDLIPIMRDSDVKLTGLMNHREYLMCLRKVREHELQEVRRVMESTVSGQNAGGTLSLHKSDVPVVLKQLGYDMWDHQAISEAAEEAGLQGMSTLDLSALWRLLLVYRQREGMRNEELQSIDAAFRREDQDGSGELNSLEVPSAVRELGYKVSFEAMQSVLRQVDVDDSHRLEPRQFRKMVRMLQERDMFCFQQVFDEYDPCALKVISAADASKAFASLGYGADKEELRKVEVVLPGLVGFFVHRDGFVRACQKHARKTRETIKRNGGWTDPEVEELRFIFRRYDVDRSGRVTKTELIHLVEDVVPELAKARSKRPQLKALMREVDQECTGSLSFASFLKLMGLFRAFKDKERLRKEQQAMKDAGFTNQEVAEFRELFLNSLNDSQELGFEEFRAMIHGITPLGDVLTSQLEEIFAEVCKKQTEADFPDFLLLLRKLLDCNFAMIKDKTNGSLRR